MLDPEEKIVNFEKIDPSISQLLIKYNYLTKNEQGLFILQRMSIPRLTSEELKDFSKVCDVLQGRALESKALTEAVLLNVEAIQAWGVGKVA